IHRRRVDAREPRVRHAHEAVHGERRGGEPAGAVPPDPQAAQGAHVNPQHHDLHGAPAQCAQQRGRAAQRQNQEPRHHPKGDPRADAGQEEDQHQAGLQRDPRQVL
ncbi:Hypothetical Protein FCC1311_113262, partial [Hondaea fermentalgiana]